MATRTRPAPRQPPQPELSPSREIAVAAQDVVHEAGFPTILIDGISGVAIINDIVRLDCFNVQLVAQNDQKPIKVARLIMSAPALVNIHAGLGLLIEQFKKDGIVSKS